MSAASGDPRLNTDAHLKVTWLELFYDLVYVATIVQLGNKLSEDLSPTGFLGFILLFVPIWWVWMGMTFYANRFVVDDLPHHLLVFAQILVVAALAINVYNGLDENAAGFALSYAAARGLLVIMYLRAAHHIEAARPLIRRYITGFTIAAALWVVSAFVPPSLRFILWAVALLIDFYTPLSPASQRLQKDLPPSSHHLPERMGLFTLIVFGESFIKVIGGFSGHEVELFRAVEAAFGLVLVACLWWIYFENIAEHAVNWARGAQIWLYMHLPLQLGLVALAVGIYKLVTLHDVEHGLPDEYRWLISGSVALILVTTAVIELFTIKREGERPGRPEIFVHIAGAVIALLVGIFGTGMNEISVIILLTVVCAAQVGYDLYRRIGIVVTGEKPRHEV